MDSVRDGDCAHLGVLLGASNLRRGIVTAVDQARRRLGERSLVLAALGHGRSFALPATFLVRTMPGILQCGLWPELSRLSASREVRVLITDVGNDLVYGAASERIVGWVEECLSRLPAHAQITLTLPPMVTLRQLGPRRFGLFRRLFFPGRALELGVLLEQAERLTESLRALQVDRRVEVVAPEPGWYGLDPIHIRRAAQPEAWRVFLRSWGPPVEAPDLALLEKTRLLCCRPQSASALGVQYGQPQPALELRGTKVGLY